MKTVIGAAAKSTMGGKTAAHSVVEPSPRLRRLAGLAVVVYAPTAVIPR